ncbi:MAG: hypothetical protein E7324_10170 [Clostridiales bacterium]|nr:hypothetical protein [Clostridiales bacterium]
MTVGFDAENTKALKDAHAANAYGYYYAYLDNQLLSYSATINNGKVVFDAGTNLGVASQIAVFGKYPLAASLMYTEAGEVSASGSGFLSAYLIACGLVLLAALVYVLMTGKLTGLSAALTAWSAVMLGFFFYATLVYKTVNIGVLLMLAAGIMFAAYTAIIRTRAIAKAIHDGNTPKSAKKLGLRASGKSVWMAHGAGLALSLIMMIFPFSRVLGYALCCGVAGSAITAPLMRLFMDCFVAITANGKRFGKV